jgi:hypothetical protein
MPMGVLSAGAKPDERIPACAPLRDPQGVGAVTYRDRILFPRKSGAVLTGALGALNRYIKAADRAGVARADIDMITTAKTERGASGG